jgi:hypothetical protein
VGGVGPEGGVGGGLFPNIPVGGFGPTAGEFDPPPVP